MRVIVKKLSREKYALKVNDLESVHLRNGAVYFNILKDKIGIKEAGSCERLTDLLPVDTYEVEGKRYQSILKLSQALLDVINSEKDYFDQTKEKVDRFEAENKPKIESILQEARKIEALKGEVGQAKFNVLSRDTRFDNPLPKDLESALRVDFKSTTHIDLKERTGSYYITLISVRGHDDLFETPAFELAVAFDGIFLRRSTKSNGYDYTTSKWDRWQGILSEESAKHLPEANKSQVKYLLGIHQEGKTVKVDINEFK